MSTTSDLSNSVRTRYKNAYNESVRSRMLYDQLCYPILEDYDKLQRASSITVPFLSAMSVGSTAISESVDITPQTLRDTTSSLTPSSRGEAIQDSELLLLQTYTDYGEQRFQVLGENMVETVEAYMLETALAGSIVVRDAARASLDAGSHELDLYHFSEAKNHLINLHCPMVMDEGGGEALIAIGHPDAFHDLRTNAPILAALQYQDKATLMNGEVGMVENVRLISSPFAKVFGGAGADNASNLATTLSSAANALATTVSLASTTNVTNGRYLTIGTEETGTTYYPMNERVFATNTDVDFVGKGPNGGFKYDHASGVAARNADSVYPILVGGPKSIAKAFAREIGEFGEVVGPKRQGLAEQFVSLAWKWYGGFARINENWLVRIEVASSLDNQ